MSSAEQAKAEVPAVTPARTISSARETSAQSLLAVVEDLLRRQGVHSEEMGAKFGSVLLSETSPLAFALEGVQVTRSQSDFRSVTQPADEQAAQ
jgi:hypothetical protein